MLAKEAGRRAPKSNEESALSLKLKKLSLKDQFPPKVVGEERKRFLSSLKFSKNQKYY
jgi:hypothetical protein